MSYLKVVLLAIVFSFFTYGHVFCATIVVDQSGDGDYTTITAGITGAYAGDVIQVLPGVYEENVVINKDVDLIGSGPKYTTVSASVDGLTVESNRTTEISNFTIVAGNDGILFESSSTGVVKNCVVVGCGRYGISMFTYAAVTAINNTIAHCASDGFYDSASSNPSIIQGNIISYNGRYGIRSGNNISYNNVYGNTGGNYYSCTAGTGDISLTPLFIDENNGNYALQSTSHCIDSGIPGEPYNDPDGTRNDMGAYSGPNSAAFWPYIPDGPVVTEIQVTPASLPRGGTITIEATGRVQ